MRREGWRPAGRQVIDGAGRSLDGGGGQPGAAALLENDAIRPHGVGGANYSPEVVGILNAVEKTSRESFGSRRPMSSSNSTYDRAAV